MPFEETGTQELLQRVARGERLDLSDSVPDAARARYVIIRLGTPSFSHIEIDMATSAPRSTTCWRCSSPGTR